MKTTVHKYLICIILSFAVTLLFVPSPAFASVTGLDSFVEFTGAASSDYFGYSWASVFSFSDINGDNYNDVIVGAYQYNSNQGRAYIFYGGPSLTSKSALEADVILTGEGTSDNFGHSVSSAGDVNGDNYDDVIVGAFGYNGGSGQGRAYIFYGGPSLTSKGAADADVILTGEAASDWLGHCVSSAGDVNGDNYDDVIVGALGYNGGARQGRAYIFYGGLSLTSKGAADADVILTGEAASDRLGHCVSSAGDVNGDNYDDIIVGAYYYSGGSKQGRAYIFYGGPSLISKGAADADVILTGETALDRFGNSVSSAGDINRDGYDDVIVSAGEYSGGSKQGRTYIFYGGLSLISKGAADADVILTGETALDRFGFPASTIGDINEDGYDDVIVGASYYPAGGSKGRAYIFYGGSSLSSKGAASADIILDGENNNDRFGCAFSLVGDVNGNGWSEWLVGAFGYPSGDIRGKAYLYNLNYASPSISMGNAFYVNTPSPTITGTASETGVNVAGVQISINNGAWSACSASDGTFNSANEAFSCPLSGLTEGTYSLRVRSYDENNVYVPLSLYARGDLVVDFTPPSDGVVTISAGGSYTNSQTVTLNITAFDALAGVNQMMISEDPNFEGAEWQPYSETVEFTLSGESGTKVIYVRFMDRAGNVSGVYSYRIELLTETGADMSHTFTLGLLLLGVLVFTEFRKVYKKV